LETEKSNLEKATELKLLQKQAHEQTSSEYNKTLAVKNAELEQTTTAKKLTAQVIAKIKARLFTLAGVADTDAPNFEQAYAYAKAAAAQTGVRPAFILAILTQESNIGKNVGMCYLQNDTTGAGININSGSYVANVMKPSRDVAPFFVDRFGPGKGSARNARFVPDELWIWRSDGAGTVYSFNLESLRAAIAGTFGPARQSVEYFRRVFGNRSICV